MLTGGGSLLYGFEQLMEQSTGIHSHVVDTALQGVALGAGKAAMFAKR